MRSGSCHLVDICTWLIVAHRHSAERLNLCLSGKKGAHVVIHVSPVLVSGHLCMVAEPSYLQRRWFVAQESCHDDYVGRTTGAVGTVTAAGWDCIASSELQGCDSGATPTATTSSALMVDMRVLGKPSNFAGEEASWKSWSFVMLSFSAAVSPLRPSRCGADSCTTCMLSLSTSGEAQRRLKNVPEGGGAEAWKAFSEHSEPLRQIFFCDFGELTQLIDRIE